MRSRAAAALALLLGVAGSAVTAASSTRAAVAIWQDASPGAAAVAARVDPVVDALLASFDRPMAMDHVRYLSRFWRLPGNAGYDASLDRIHERISEEVSVPRGAGAIARSAPRLTFTAGAPARGWDHDVATLAIVSGDAPDDVVLSRERDRLALCINSFSTPPGGLTAPLVDAGGGDRDEDYAGKDVKGAVVLGDADAGQLWRRAVVARGAIGIVSAALAPYVSPDPPGAAPTPRDQWDILQWGSIPYDEARKGFGFKASPRAAARLRAALRRPNGVLVRVTIASSFTTNPVRTLAVEFPGSTAPDERVVMAAHVQEPGANDNASGVATLAELAIALWRGIAKQQIPAPSRTLTFLFLNEISGSREWLKTNAGAVPHVKYMLSLDMTGEDVTRTGGSFLVERYPDPGAVWDRPWDPHSEWGRGDVRAEQLKGDLINDVHLAIAARVTARTGWVVKSNPYEGGSDHTVFGSAGIPSVLDWHFTDRYYHTNFDTPDKSSANEMRNVAAAVGATAWFFAAADAKASLDAARLVAAAGRARIAVEEREGAKLASADPNPSAARAREATILAAWRKWYAEAVRSTSRLVVGAPSPEFAPAIDAIARDFEPRLHQPGVGRSFRAGTRLAEPSANDVDRDRGPAADDTPAQALVRAATHLFRCGSDQTIATQIPLRWETVALAIDGRLYAPCGPPPHAGNHREAREGDVLARAQRSLMADLRRMAAQGAGRLQRFPIQRLIDDAEPAVRRSAAVAIADAAAPLAIEPRNAGARIVANTAVPVLRGQAPPELSQTERIRAARRLLEARLAVERDPEVFGTLLESLGRLRYETDAERDEVEALIVSRRDAHPAIRNGAVKGLEALIRPNAKRPIADETRTFLRAMTTVGTRAVGVPTVAGRGTAPAPGEEDLNARTRLLAVSALNAARDDDVLTMTEIARDPEWQVRRLIVPRLDPTRSEHRVILTLLAVDPSPNVRYELVTPIARAASTSKHCGELARFLDDASMTVVLRAIDALPDDCAGEDDLVKQLVVWAEDLERPVGIERWHRPARAFTTLARIRPEAAEPFDAMAVKHPIWQVRAAAVLAAERMGKEEHVRARLADAHPNVRTAALLALRRLNSPALPRAAIDALGADDFDLIRTAAIVLEDAPADVREDATAALLATFRRLTEAAWDTSRDPRVAIVERLGDLMAPERASELPGFVEDFDPRVGDAAGRAFMRLTGMKDPPERKNPWVRYPLQPLVEELSQAPTRAIVKMKDLGSMEVELYPGEAPVTVALFASLARSGYYDGLTFHRVVPNFVVQGGSPNANEYAGTERYMRDEVGTIPHLRGSLGISTRGRDTGDGQFFIDLVDLPRLDHEYTVFGRVVVGYDVLDRILEGAVIESITLK